MLLRRLFAVLSTTRASGAGLAFIGLALLGVAEQAKAAVPVEDMSTRDVRPEAPIEPASVLGTSGGAGADSATSSAPPSRTPSAGRRQAAPGENAQLFYELQALQTELQQLRGLVDDQTYEITRLRNLQRSQYLDIDRRLTEDGRSVSQLSQIAPEPTRSQQRPQEIVAQGPVRDTSNDVQVRVPVVQTGAVATAVQVRQPVPDARSASSPASVVSSATSSAAPEVIAPTEQVAFEQAFDLMKDQQFEQSIAAYQGVVESFPDGRYAPESRYWLGELYLMSDRLEAARGSFASVVEVFPAHQKVPLSLYKLGVVNHRLGATPAALEYLDSVVMRYPDTPAAGLARAYAAELR